MIRLKWKFIFILPLFNLIADMTFTFFSGYSEPTLIRAGINLLFLFYTVGHEQLGKLRIRMYIFFVWILILLILSEEFKLSLRVAAQIIISMSMLFAGYTIFMFHEGFERFINYLKYIIYISIIATLFGYLFNIGRTLEYTLHNPAGVGPENVGLLGSGSMYVPGVVLGLLPLVLKNQKKRIDKVLLLGASILLFILILLNVRRTAIIIPFLGLFGFFLYAPPRFRLRITYYVAVGVLVLIFSYPLYSDILNRRMDIRREEGRLEMDFYKTEQRYTDNQNMINAIINFKEPLKVMTGIGNSLFVDIYSYGNEAYRMIHADIPKIFYSLGLVGVISYLLIYVSIFKAILSVRNEGLLKDLKAGCFGLFLISFLMSINGSITLFSFRAFTFLLMGSFLGYSQKLKHAYGELPPHQANKV